MRNFRHYRCDNCRKWFDNQKPAQSLRACIAYLGKPATQKEVVYAWFNYCRNCVRGKIMYPSVKNVAPTEDHILSVDFDNGETGVLDMKPYLDFGVLQRLKEHDVFNRVRVSFNTIEWDSGIDLDPEFVYNKTQRKLGEQVLK